MNDDTVVLDVKVPHRGVRTRADTCYQSSVVSFLHVTDPHFGDPHGSVGIGKSLKPLLKHGALPPRRSLNTWMATHDRDVVLALTDLVVELQDELDAIVLTGDIATTSAKTALTRAKDWIESVFSHCVVPGMACHTHPPGAFTSYAAAPVRLKSTYRPRLSCSRH